MNCPVPTCLECENMSLRRSEPGRRSDYRYRANILKPDAHAGIQPPKHGAS
ncbi:hypothetical protein KCP73_17745 [Salmonella enterica subsp. enterica]|nr:hypothetical protein KCP73_17745 [Salmonella enterica subsp. enterica]